MIKASHHKFTQQTHFSLWSKSSRRKLWSTPLTSRVMVKIDLACQWPCWMTQECSTLLGRHKCCVDCLYLSFSHRWQFTAMVSLWGWDFKSNRNQCLAWRRLHLGRVTSTHNFRFLLKQSHNKATQNIWVHLIPTVVRKIGRRRAYGHCSCACVSTCCRREKMAS